MPTLAHVQKTYAQDGFRVLTEDEWEWSAGGGSQGLYRWGNALPIDELAPGQDLDGEKKELRRANGFGLWIGQDPYCLEHCVGWLKGGDGGVAWCGGEGAIRIWASLMLPRRFPSGERTGAHIRRCRELPSHAS